MPDAAKPNTARTLKQPRRRQRRVRSQSRTQHSTAARLPSEDAAGTHAIDAVQMPRVRCSACAGSGAEQIPNMAGMTSAELAERAAISRAYVTRLLSPTSTQRRKNPSLQVMRAICTAVEAATGSRLSLDALARVITAE